MKYNWKRMLAASLSACMCLGLMAAPQMVYGEEGDGSAMGRYLEQDLDIPDVMVRDIARLEDGTIRLLGGPSMESEEDGSPYTMWDSTDGGETWEQAAVLPEEFDDAYFMDMTLASDGSAAGILYSATESEDGNYDTGFQYYVFAADGTPTKLEVPEDTMLQYLRFGSQGELIGQTFDNSAVRINTESGEIEQTFPAAGEYLNLIGVCGQELLMIGADVQRYDIASGEPLPFDQVLNDQMMNGEVSYSITSTSTIPVDFDWTEDGRIYYCNRQGIFGHVPDGSVVEEIVDGDMTSLSSPSVGLIAMAVSDGEFYVAYQADGPQTKVMKYVYSADTPTVPDKELTVYSLEENAEIRQAIVTYQKKQPDTMVHYEIGLSGEDGVTASDALRTLNTDIMAGNGPDVLVLDGMPIASYIEKGVLTDLGEIRKEVQETDGLLNAMTTAWEQEGVPYALPIRFQVPALEGKSELIGKAENLEQLADMIEETSADGTPALGTSETAVFPYMLYPVCAGAWRNEDGTVNQDSLLEYMTLGKRVYDSQMEGRSEEESSLIGMYSNYFMGDADYMFTLGAGMLSFLEESRSLSLGVLADVHDLNCITSVKKKTGDCEFQLLPGQQENVFIPSGLIGINSMTKNSDSAQDFVKYLFSKEAQSQALYGGFPLNRSALEAILSQMEPGTDTNEAFFSSNQATGESVEVVISWMSQEVLDQFLSYVEQLDTAADTDTILRDAVYAQMQDCLNGNISPEDAVNAVMQTVNLYLAEG